MDIILKPIRLILTLILILPINSYSEILKKEHPLVTADKTCITDGTKNLGIRYPYITPDDAYHISLYACSCVYKASKKSLIKAEAEDFRNVHDCIYFGVLRNSIRYAQKQALEKKPIDSTFLKQCIATFPRDMSDDSVNIDVNDFCQCASPLTEKIAKEIHFLKINNDEMSEKLMEIVKGCRYSV